MGCACSKSNLSKTPVIIYSVYYCSLMPIKENIYKSWLILKIFKLFDSHHFGSISFKRKDKKLLA